MHQWNALMDTFQRWTQNPCHPSHLANISKYEFRLKCHKDIFNGPLFKSKPCNRIIWRFIIWSIGWPRWSPHLSLDAHCFPTRGIYLLGFIFGQLFRPTLKFDELSYSSLFSSLMKFLDKMVVFFGGSLSILELVVLSKNCIIGAWLNVKWADPVKGRKVWTFAFFISHPWVMSYFQETSAQR